MTDEAVLTVLAVDDDKPALDELVSLLDADPRVFAVYRADDAAEALRVLRDTEVDVVVLDIRMPGLDGVKLTRALRRFTQPPAIIVVTVDDDKPEDPFDLGITDHLRRPVQADLLAESLRQVAAVRTAPVQPSATSPTDEVTIAVPAAGTSWQLPRAAVRWAESESAGDGTRLHTAGASHLVQVSLATLTQQWAPAGFVRIHRSFLVPVRLIAELRVTPSGYVVTVDGTELPVGRQHARALKDTLVRAAKRDWPG